VPTTTWRSLLTEIVGPFGLVEAATTTNIAANTAVVSTQLQSRYGTDSALNGMWLTVLADSSGTAASNANATRQITAYTASSGTIAVTGPAWAAESEAVDFLVTSVHPADAIRAFNRARQQSHPQVAIVRDDRALTTGYRQQNVLLPSTIRDVRQVWIEILAESSMYAENLFRNSDFEDWSSATSPDDWTIAGAGASVNQEAQTSQSDNYGVLTGSNSARIVVPLNTATTLLQTIDATATTYPNVATEGMEINTAIMAYSTTASRISNQIATVNGSTHAGGGWELMTQSANLAATATTAAAGVAGTSGAAMPTFIDNATCTIGPKTELEHGWDLLHGWERLPAAAGGANGGTLSFKSSNFLPPKHRLRIIGTDVISAVTGVDSTVEVDGEQLDPLVWKTRQNLAQEGYSMSMFLGQTAAAGNTVSYCGRMYEEAINEGRRTHLPTQMQSVMPHYKVRR
jgi:hypothetical protein